MRLALIIAACAGLTACQAEPAATGPERRSAAGEVLGGEVTDDMLPLDTVRSSSPAGSSEPADEPEPGASRSPRGAGSEKPLPRPELSAAPLPDMTMPADPEPMPTAGQ